MLTLVQMQLCLFFSGLRKHILLDLIMNCLLRSFRVEENVLISCACIPTLGPFFELLQSKNFKGAFRAGSHYWSTRGRSDQIALRDYDSHSKVKDSNAKFSGAGQDVESLDMGSYRETKISREL